MAIEQYIPIILGILAIPFLILAVTISKNFIFLEHLFLIIVEIMFIGATGLATTLYSIPVVTALYLVSIGLFALTIVIIFIEYFIMLMGIFQKKGAIT